MKICQFWGREFMSLSQKYEEGVRNFYIFARHLFKAELYVIFISLSLVSICQNYIRLYINKFLDSQCMLARRTSNIKSLVNCPRPPCPYIQVGQERGREKLWELSETSEAAVWKCYIKITCLNILENFHKKHQCRGPALAKLQDL